MKKERILVTGSGKHSKEGGVLRAEAQAPEALLQPQGRMLMSRLTREAWDRGRDGEECYRL